MIFYSKKVKLCKMDKVIKFKQIERKSFRMEENMKKVIILIMVLSIFGTVFAKKIGSFKEVLRPEMIAISSDHIYVVEGSTIFVYSLKGLKFITKFGRKGEGPGELKSVSKFSNTVLIYPDFIFAESIDKIVYFSKEGKLINEKRKFPESFRFMPLGENFAGKKVVADDQGRLYSTVNLFNSKMEKVKELYRQKFFQQGTNIELIPESLNFWVCENKIFIEESTKGFLIEVFDSNGVKLYQIEKKYERLKVSAENKEEIIEELKQDPRTKEQGWENIKQIINFTFADSFPPIQDIIVLDKKIYVKTFKKQGNKEEFLVMNLKGELQKSLYLPTVKSRYLKQLAGLGPKFYSIENDKFYYLFENEEGEWELHSVDISGN